MTDINNKLDEKITKIISNYKKKSNQNIANGIINNITNLVLSGGGFRGIAILGALKIFNELHLLDNVQTIATSSVGSLIAGLYCMGYNIEELQKIILNLEIDKVICFNPANLFDSFALDTGERFEFVISKIIESKKFSKNITLKEVYNIKKIKLIITGTCLNDSQVHYFSHINYPDMPLLTCIRLSTSVPFIFKPVLYKNKTYVDGSVMDNYPIHLFKNEMENTIGIYVKDSHEYKHDIFDIQNYTYSVFECALEGQTQQTCFFPDNSLIIELPYVSLVGKIETKTKKELFVIGCEKAKQFIKSKNLLKN